MATTKHGALITRFKGKGMTLETVEKWFKTEKAMLAYLSKLSEAGKLYNTRFCTEEEY